MSDSPAGAPALRGADACEACLRRSWLVARLVDHIARAVDDRPGSRSEELLALENTELAAAVAPARATTFLAEAAERGAADVAAEMSECGAWASCEHSADYPPGLRDLGPARPRVLICLGDRSHLRDLTPKGSVAIVGARRSSGYGNRVAHGLGRQLAQSGLAVVSGMAYGIDAAAHTGALDGGGVTLAVLGGGCAVPYPASNAALYRRIRRRGLIVSELPPRTAARRWTFPARNRTMAAIAGIAVIVQARMRSGSLITARQARELGRDVGAVPGDVDSDLSKGANSLIADGAAVIRDADDVLDALLGPGARRAPPRPPVLDPPLNAALVAVGEGAVTPDAVAQAAELDGRSAAVALSKLEMLGLITRSASGTYARTSLTQ
jgi:DNA processing protein